MAIMGIAIAFGIRALQTNELLPVPKSAFSGTEMMQARFWTNANAHLTEVLWPVYWFLLPIYWLLKTYRDQAIHRTLDTVVLLPALVFTLLVVDAAGLRTWMWG